MNGLVDTWIVETKRDWTNPSIQPSTTPTALLNPPALRSSLNDVFLERSMFDVPRFKSPNGLARWLFPAIIVALVGAQLSLAEQQLWELVVASSNPVAPTAFLSIAS
jgi:hypothetical protein